MATFAFLVPISVAYPKYQNKIPNGHNIPSPNNPKHHVHGVGHIRTGGKGPLNKFGRDFYDHEKVRFS